MNTPKPEPTFGQRVMALPPETRILVIRLLDAMLAAQARDDARKAVQP